MIFLDRSKAAAFPTSEAYLRKANQNKPIQIGQEIRGPARDRAISLPARRKAPQKTQSRKTRKPLK
jgi:hypothetical protein